MVGLAIAEIEPDLSSAVHLYLTDLHLGSLSVLSVGPGQAEGVLGDEVEDHLL